MPLEVSFLFGGQSMEYESSISSLENCIASYLAIPPSQRPFSVGHLYHLSQQDGLARSIRFHSDYTFAELQECILNIGKISGSPLSRTFDAIAERKEYVVNLLHGQFGEDGGVQTIAALSGIKGTFGDPQVASLTMNKYAMSSFVSSLLPAEVVKMPKTKLINARNLDDAIQIAHSFRGPIVVKPNSLGLSLFTALFPNPAACEADISDLARKILSYDSAALFQEFIQGDEYSCGSMIDARDVMPLPVVKIETESHFFGPIEKSNRGSVVKRIVDGNEVLSTRIKSITKEVTSSIDLYNVARLDFRVDANADIFFLECNYIPGLAKGSIFDMALQSHGMTVIELIAWIASRSRSFARKDYIVKNDE